MGDDSKVLATKVSYQNIDERAEGQRIDNFLLKLLKGVPKSKIYQIIRKGEVRINKRRCKPGTKLLCGDMVRIPPLKISEGSSDAGKVPRRIKELLNDSILFEDDGLIVINKPHGIAVHGGSGVSHGVIEILRQVRQETRYLELVHRLDRDTSGVLLIAKKRRVLVELHSMLQNGRIIKNYLAWVDGKWPVSKTTITAPLRKSVLKSGERIVVVSADGKPCETSFAPSRFASGERSATNFGSARACTLIKASPLTGRTHQIRVHCQFAGHPIIGDPKYCPADINQAHRAKGAGRMCLHAESVELDWSGDKPQIINAPWALMDSPYLC